jgi:hypothetical protein
VKKTDDSRIRRSESLIEANPDQGLKENVEAASRKLPFFDIDML